MIKVLLDKRAKGEIFNVGNPNEISILELANTIVRLTRSRSNVIHEPEGEDDPKRRCPDISKIRSKLGWAPSVKLEEGLKRTLR